MNKSKKIVSKFIPLITALIIVISGIVWYIQTSHKQISIPFSSVEKTIQAQNGKVVSLTEYADGSLYLKTGNTEYVSHIPPNSQAIEKLVENYNINYTYTTSSRYGKWIMGGIILLLAGAAFAVQKQRVVSAFITP